MKKLKLKTVSELKNLRITNIHATDYSGGILSSLRFTRSDGKTYLNGHQEKKNYVIEEYQHISKIEVIMTEDLRYLAQIIFYD